MSDIVERLRGKPIRHDYFPEADRQEAADEIERLRAVVNDQAATIVQLDHDLHLALLYRAVEQP